VSGDLEKKLAVPAFLQKLTRPRPFHWHPAQDEGTGSEPEILVGFLSLQTNTGDRLCATKSLFRDEKLRMNFAENRSCSGETGTA
jgi:hypothetical protein